jgi:amino acid efflux transporter
MLTVKQGAALSVGAVLGTGVIALPGIAAQVAGPAALIAWVALIALSAPLALTFAALGARYPDAGGVATYVSRAFGPRAAAVVGWTFYFAVPVGALPAATFGGAYVTAVLGGGYRTTLLTAAALIALVTAANLGGVRLSGRVQLGLAAVLVALLLAAIVTALPHADPANLRPFAPHGWLAIGPAIAVLVWGFAGWEALTSLAADYRHPRRDVPRATWIAVGVVGLLYLAVAATSQLVLAEPSEAPLADLLAIGFGPGARVLTAVLALLLTAGAMNAYFAGAARLGAALGRDGALPAWFARGSAAGEVPRRSLAVVAGLAAVTLGVAAATGLGPRPLMLLTTGSFVVVYVLGTAAAVRLLPAGSWARRWAGFALLSVLGLLALTGRYVLWTLVVAAAALAYQRLARHRPPTAGPAADGPAAGSAAGRSAADRPAAGSVAGGPAGDGPAGVGAAVTG